MDNLFLPDIFGAVNNSCSHGDELHATLSMLHRVKLCYLPLLVAFGITGNLLTLITYHRLASLPPYVYLCTLSGTDIIFLISIFINWLRPLSPALQHPVGLCQPLVFIHYICIFISIWLLVGLSIERFIVIHLPQYVADRVSNPSRTKVITITIVIIAIVVYLNISVLYGETQNHSGQVDCLPLERFVMTVQTLDVIDMIINLILPYLVLIFTSSVTMVTLIKLYRNRKMLVRAPGGEGSWCVAIERKTQPQMALTRMCLVYIWLFLLLNLPINTHRLSTYRREVCEGLQLCQEIFWLLVFTRSGISFPVHYVCNSSFRKAFKALLGSHRSYISASRRQSAVLANIVRYSPTCSPSSTL